MPTEYAEEMRARAQERIRRRREKEDVGAVLDAYMRTMFDAFMRRVERKRAEEAGTDCGPEGTEGS